MDLFQAIYLTLGILVQLRRTLPLTLYRFSVKYKQLIAGLFVLTQELFS